jgi:ABC-2 type transport system ATP-binding protein
VDTSIEVTDLQKRFGDTVALDGLTFVVQPGQITGFVGPNGAGKSTTMRCILGLNTPSGGRATVGGRPYRDLPNPLRTVGSLLDATAVHPTRKARHHLLWMAYSNGIPARRVDEVLAMVGLESAANRRAGGFSLGMSQRLGIAAALLGDPPVLMLDEPMNGLDPEGFQWMRGLLREFAAEGRAVLVSSHLMSELEGSADHLVVIGRGRLVADTNVRELLDRASGGRVSLRTSLQRQAMSVLANAGATVAAPDHDALTVSGLTSEAVIAALSGHGVPFSEISAHRASLEEAYLELTRPSAEFSASGSGSDDA